MRPTATPPRPGSAAPHPRCSTASPSGDGRSQHPRFVCGTLALTSTTHTTSRDPARRSLRRLLEEESLGPYVPLAESGALRTRLVGGQRPATSEATNEIRRKCVDGPGPAVLHQGADVLSRVARQSSWSVSSADNGAKWRVLPADFPPWGRFTGFSGGGTGPGSSPTSVTNCGAESVPAWAAAHTR